MATYQFTDPKDPTEVLDYTVSFANELAGRLVGGADDTILTHLVVPDSGITLDSSSHDDSSVEFWVSGGTAGVGYEFEVTITTLGGRTYNRSVKIKVKDI